MECAEEPLGIPRHGIELVGGEVLEAGVAVREQVHRRGFAHHHAPGCERASAREPQARGVRHGARVRLASEHRARRHRRVPSRRRTASARKCSCGCDLRPSIARAPGGHPTGPSDLRLARRHRPTPSSSARLESQSNPPSADRDDLLAAVAARAVVPDDRFEHEHHARFEHDRQRRTRRHDRCRSSGISARSVPMPCAR